jgi:hypothetical protein
MKDGVVVDITVGVVVGIVYVWMVLEVLWFVFWR